MATEINAHLCQQGSYGQMREYQIVNGKNIRIAVGKKNRNKVFSVPMLALAENCQTQTQIAWAWLWLAVIGIIAIPAYLLVKASLGAKGGFLDLAILGMLILAVLVGLAMLVMNFARKRVYYTAYSRVPLFDILISKPNNQAYKQFLDVLDSLFQQTRNDFDLKPEQQIAGEIRMLRRLANEGVITQKAYEEAKDKLFSMTSQSSNPAS